MRIFTFVYKIVFRILLAIIIIGSIIWYTNYYLQFQHMAFKDYYSEPGDLVVIGLNVLIGIIIGFIISIPLWVINWLVGLVFGKECPICGVRSHKIYKGGEFISDSPAYSKYNSETHCREYYYTFKDYYECKHCNRIYSITGYSMK